MDAIWSHIADYPYFYGAVSTLALSMTLGVILMNSPIAKGHESALNWGMSIGAMPAGLTMIGGFFVGLSISPISALVAAFLLMPFVLASALVGGVLGIFVSLAVAIRKTRREQPPEAN
jgi:hypothetical protein